MFLRIIRPTETKRRHGSHVKTAIKLLVTCIYSRKPSDACQIVWRMSHCRLELATCGPHGATTLSANHSSQPAATWVSTQLSQPKQAGSWQPHKAYGRRAPKIPGHHMVGSLPVFTDEGSLPVLKDNEPRTPFILSRRNSKNLTCLKQSKNETRMAGGSPRRSCSEAGCQQITHVVCHAYNRQLACQYLRHHLQTVSHSAWDGDTL